MWNPTSLPFRNTLPSLIDVVSLIGIILWSNNASYIPFSSILIETLAMIVKWLMIPTFPPSGDSEGHTNPHCELWSFLGPIVLEPAGIGYDNLLIWDNVPNIDILFKSWTIPFLADIPVPNEAPNDLLILSIILLSNILLKFCSLIILVKSCPSLKLNLYSWSIFNEQLRWYIPHNSLYNSNNKGPAKSTRLLEYESLSVCLITPKWVKINCLTV